MKINNENKSYHVVDWSS